jgi:DnaJ-class molecular chaperone
MKEINIAHGILLDPESRQKYDESLLPNSKNQNVYDSQTYYASEENNGEPPPLFESLKEHKILILAAIVIIGIIIFGEKKHQVGTSPKLDTEIQNIPREKLI